MSAIDKTRPLDTDLASEGDDRLREERQWLLDLWTKFISRYREGLVPNDPGTSLGEFKIPSVSSGIVGDMYFGPDLVAAVVTSAGDRSAGTIASGSKCVFHTAAAPSGWTRDSSLVDGSVLRYVASGTPGGGGTHDIVNAFTHTLTMQSATFRLGSPPATTNVAAHSVLLSIDVIIATKV